MDEIATEAGSKLRKPPRVVIVGAGFAGLRAARALALSHISVEVLLVDRSNHHVFLPLLYQVAAAELQPEDIAYPIRSILRKWPNVRFVMAEATRINFETRVVKTDGRPIEYDFLILGVGSTSQFFGVPGATEHAFPLKTIEEAMALRNQILGSFERAAHEPDAARRRRMLTFVIVGGGPTGIEFAAALAELIRGPLVRDFPTLDFGEVRIVVVEARNQPGLPENLCGYALERLHGLGVELRLGAAVSQVTPVGLHFRDGSIIPTEAVVWTAGVRGVAQAETWGLPTARNGQVRVSPTLEVANHPNVYVVGDLAFVEEDGQPLPMVAPVAVQQGAAAARNILRQLSGRELVPFRYANPGMMVTIGRNAAVARIHGRSFTGFFAWLLWVGVHIFKLIGFRNRMLVLINWAWDYLFFERAVRLILPVERARATESAASADGKAAVHLANPAVAHSAVGAVKGLDEIPG